MTGVVLHRSARRVAEQGGRVARATHFQNALYAIPAQTAVSEGSWPMFRHNQRHTANVKTLQLRGEHVVSSTNFLFDVVGPAGVTCTVEYTTDFSSWTSLGTVTLTNGVTTIQTAMSGSAYRFYRARLTE